MATNHTSLAARWARLKLIALCWPFLAAGCASAAQVTSGHRTVPVLRGVAAELKIDKLWVRETPRGWEISGYVVRWPDVPVDTPDHVDVVQLDANGQVVKITHVPLSGWRKQPRLRSRLASFEVALTGLADSTARIEVLPQPGAPRS